MSDPSPMPPKKEVANVLLGGPSMFIHLDPRRDGVVVPKQFSGQPQLVLQVGPNMAIPIPDLDVDDEAISCTLSFNRRPFWCRMPWTAVYALVGEDGRGMIWPESVPPELAVQDGRPKLHAVSSGKPPRDRTQPTGADKTPGAREQVDRAAADEKQASVAADHAAPARARADAPAVSSSGGAASGAQREQPPKRELPPYLRVVK